MDKFEAEVDDLRQHVFKLEDELKSAKKALEKAHGPSYSEVVQKSATKARAPPALGAQASYTIDNKVCFVNPTQNR